LISEDNHCASLFVCSYPINSLCQSISESWSGLVIVSPSQLWGKFKTSWVPQLMITSSARPWHFQMCSLNSQATLEAVMSDVIGMTWACLDRQLTTFMMALYQWLHGSSMIRSTEMICQWQPGTQLAWVSQQGVQERSLCGYTGCSPSQGCHIATHHWPPEVVSNSGCQLPSASVNNWGVMVGLHQIVPQLAIGGNIQGATSQVHHLPKYLTRTQLLISIMAMKQAQLEGLKEQRGARWQEWPRYVRLTGIDPDPVEQDCMPDQRT